MSPVSRGFRHLRRPHAGEEGRVPPGQSWQQFQDLPAGVVTTDIHCVTRWSKLDTQWQGVPVDALLAEVEHDAAYVLAFCDGGYTTNLPVEDLTDGA